MAKCNSLQSAETVAADCAAWPAAARRHWEAAFEPDLGTHDWARASQYTYARVFSRYLAVVRAEGLPDEPCALSPDGLRAFLGLAEKTCTARSLAGHVHHLVEVATIIYREEARAGHLDWLWTTRNRLLKLAGRTPKQRRRNVVSAIDLLQVAAAAINEGRARGDFVRLRTGVFILLGLYAPERRRALAGLDVNMIDFDARQIAWPANSQKTRQPVVRVIPPRVVAVLSDYITRWRAQYVAAGERALFIKATGTRVGGEALRTAMVNLTEEKLDRIVSPHLMRNAVATAVLASDPANAALASIAIGHGSRRMTREYTETAKGIAAGRQVRGLMKAAEIRVARLVRTDTRSRLGSR